jgi:hypothetical protein
MWPRRLSAQTIRADTGSFSCRARLRLFIHTRLAGQPAIIAAVMIATPSFGRGHRGDTAKSPPASTGKSRARGRRDLLSAVEAVWLAGGGALPPVDDLVIVGEPFEHPSDHLNMYADAARPAELPEFLGGTMIVVDRFVDGVGVDGPGTVSVEVSCYMFNELSQRCLMVGRHEGPSRPALCLRPHGGTRYRLYPGNLCRTIRRASSRPHARAIS